MKKAFIRSLSWVLSVMMIFGVIVIIPITANAIDSKLEKAVQWAINIANDDSHGYSQENRWGPDYDCSSFVISALKNAGMDVGNASYTGNMVDELSKRNFQYISWGDTGGVSGLRRGDIMWRSGHTEMYIGNNQQVGAHWHNGHTATGDPSGTEISVQDFYYNDWECVLRYSANSDTVKAGNNVEETIYNFFRNTMGVNTAVTCGVLANIEKECDFNPKESCIDTNGLESYGICQWNGERFTNLKNYCSNNGYDYTDVTGQLRFLKYELENSEKSAWSKVKDMPDTAQGAYDAGYNWARYFERCASKYYTERAELARDKYNNIPNWESMPAGEKYYFKNNGTGTYMSVDSGEDVQGKNISVYQKTGDAGQQFEIRSSDSDRTYYLRPVLCESSGRVVNVYSESSYNGANVTIYNFTGHSTQQWKFRKVDGGYAICSANNTSTCLAESGTNVQLATYTGAANQIWTLENVVPPVPKGRVMSESEAAGRTIPDGDYYVVNGISPDYFLDISGNSFDIQNGTNLQMWTWGSSIPDREGYDCFHFEYLNNGFYKITQMGTNMCIDVCGGSLERGTNIYMWNDNGNNAQQWSVEKTTHGYRFRSKCNAYYLDVYGAEHAGGTNIWCWDSNNAEPQSFGLIPRDLNEKPVADGVYIIRPNVSSQHFLDIAGTPDEFHAGSNVQIWRSADSAEEDKFAVTYVGDGWYKITEQTSGLALSLSDTEENFLNEFKNVQLDTCSGGKNQLWKIRENSDGTYSVINKTSGYYLDLYFAKNDNGTNVSQHPYNGEDAQKWIFEPDVSVDPDKKGNFNGHTYEYYNYPLKWFDAYRFCEKKGGHLVTISSKKEDDFISGLVQNNSVWIGGRTFDNSPWMWITGESFDYQNWGLNQPDNYNDSEDALQYSISDQGTVYWNDAPRKIAFAFICEYDNTIDASQYIPAYKTNYNGHEYWYFENRVDWQTAKKICEAKGGYLAIPNNADENAMIIAGLKNTSNAWAWIGITDIAQEGIWKDVKGNVIQYTNWSSPQPDNYGGREDYVHMYEDGTWNDANCGCNCCNNVGFVCEFDDLQTVPSDPNAPSIVVGQKLAVPGQTVTVDISMKNNPGITGFKINVSYNKNVLTLQNAETIGFDAMYSQNMTAMPFIVSWESGLQDVKLDGEIIRLTFAVNKNAADGSYPVTVSYQPDDIYNLKEENIHFAVINGSVKVRQHIPGDINNDGKVNMKDVTRLHQYINGWDVAVVESAIDVNGDGKVNMKDLTRLHQYINGWDVVIY